MNRSKLEQSSVPRTKLARMTQLGKLVGGVAGNILAQGSKQWMQGKRPSSQALLLTPQNAQRMADHLAHMRGAAMKVGQLLSMDAGELIPDELSEILARLRAEAKSMPLNDLQTLLAQEWGPDWQAQFTQFSFYPIAAASIGQVHEAHTPDGRHLALKIQYPGIAQSIDSDVDNIAKIINWSGLVPSSVELAPILAEAKNQLHNEANYHYEAECLRRYQEYLAADERFLIPKVHEDLSGQYILAMDFVQGQPIESCLTLSQETRNTIMSTLFECLFLEMFQFKLVQTDPNFANYQFQAETQRIVLLDFGATRVYSERISQGYLHLLRAAMHEDVAAITLAAEQIGFFSEHILPHQKEAVIELFIQACEPLRSAEAYDFARSDLAGRIKDKGMALSMEQDYWHTPPVDALFFHRKLAGLYLMAAKLQVQVPMQRIFKQMTHTL